MAISPAQSPGAKGALRQRLRERLDRLAPEAFHAEGLAAAALIRSLPLWNHYSTILIFLSTASEIDTGPLLEAAFADGKAVFVPKTAGKRLQFFRAPSPAGPWEAGPFGIREPPPAGASLGTGDFPFLVITPGLGFDRQGGRLGRGGGFYDRFFAELDAAARPYCALGLCTGAQLLDHIPMEGRDKRMHGLIAGAIPVCVP